MPTATKEKSPRSRSLDKSPSTKLPRQSSLDKSRDKSGQAGTSRDKQGQTKKIVEIDASGQILGRLASRIAYELMRKNSPHYDPSVFSPASITVMHASKIRVSGKKMKQKTYKRYSGYPSGLKERTMEEQFKRDPTEILRNAVWGMLPKNKLQKRYMEHLTITE